jgi:hypothetical protein
MASPRPAEGPGNEWRAGHGIDPTGGQVVDPTKNVLDLVRAESLRQDGLRDAERRINDLSINSLSTLTSFAREAESKLQTWMRDAESKRTDQLTETRQIYEKRIADMLSESVRDKSALVSAQLLQIQSTFDARISKLEEFRLTSQGKSSVADPMIADALAAQRQNHQEMQAMLARTVADLGNKQTAAVDKLTDHISRLNASESGASNKDIGRREIIAWIVAGLLLLASISSAIFQGVSARAH